jgi:exo-poly-alpha-galacturonosidase
MNPAKFILYALAMLAVSATSCAQPQPAKTEPNVPAACEPGSAKQYVVTRYGAVGDGRTLNTEAIQSAIDMCRSEGGGVLVIPEGTFLTGSLFFKQGVDLHLEKGARLKGTVNPDDYPQVDTRWEGEEKVWTAALVNFFDMTDVDLTGEGMIDGSGDQWMERFPRGSRELHTGRPRLIAVQNCKDVKVCNFSFKNHACWGLFILYSEDVLVQNLTIRAAHNIISSDGIDVDSSRNVRITGCDIDVNDDCIAIKSGKDEDGRRVNRPAEDVVVENCHFRYGHGGVSMGSEMSGGIRNVEIRNCVMDADNWAPIRFKSQPSRGGVVENITYRDIELNGTRKAFEFNMAWRMVPPLKPPSNPLPVVRNVNIINVSGTVNVVGDMYGLEDSPIQNVTFKNCTIKAERGFTIENVEGLDLSGLDIQVEEGEPIIRKNAQD